MARASCQASLLLATALFTVQCARSGLDPGDLEYSSAGTVSSGGTSSGGTSSGGTSSGGTSSGGTSSGGTSSGGTSSGGQTMTVPGCSPSPEICNGRDDDCNGKVDEIDPVACPGGGYSYCVAGRMSACPKRCESCVPGSERVCFVSYCELWGVQTCTADGRTFGTCQERTTPSSCKDAAGSDGRNIAGLERCCIDQGFCCVDSEDLDGDGNRNEMLGKCEDVTCN